MKKRLVHAASALAALVAVSLMSLPGVANATTLSGKCPTGNNSIEKASYVFYGTDGKVRTATTLWGNSKPGDTIKVKFHIADGCKNVPVSFVSYTAPDDEFDPKTASKQKLYNFTTGKFSSGWHTLKVKVPDTTKECKCKDGHWSWKDKHKQHNSHHPKANYKGEVKFDKELVRNFGADAEHGYNKHGGKKHHIHPICAKFYQVDFVRGPVIKQLGPAGSDNFYSAQGRLIDNDFG